MYAKEAFLLEDLFGSTLIYSVKEKKKKK